MDTHDARTLPHGLSKIVLGTSAWSYADWRSVFYPEKLPQAHLLEWYSRYFNGVEVDSTFYHLPTARSTQHWAEVTPSDFTFTVKLTRTMTHERRLVGCEPLLTQFLKGLEPLGEKLGAVLIQLPGSFKPSRDEEALRRFTASLPTGWRFAVEFRDRSWFHPRIIQHLQKHGVAWAWTDTEPFNHEEEGAFEPLPITADFIYLRLLGDLSTKYFPGGVRQIERYDHIRWPRDHSLENWVVKIRHHEKESQRLFLFAANHFEGCSPLTAQRLAKGLHLPQSFPKLEDYLPSGDPKPGESSQLELL